MLRPNRKAVLLSILFLLTQPLTAGGKYSAFERGHRTEFDTVLLPEENIVYSIAEDDRGAIWFGTKRGLVFYDGFHPRTYFHPGGSALNTMNAIIQYDPSTLCIGTDGGIVFFDLREDKFIDVQGPLSDIRAVRSLTIFGDDLWIGTLERGLLRYNRKKAAIEEIKVGGLEETLIYDMCELDGELYVGSYEALSCYDPLSSVRRRIPLPGNPVISSIIPCGKDGLWIAAGNTLYKWNKESGVVWEKVFPDCLMRKIISSGDGRIVIGTDAGLFFLDEKSGRVESCLHDSGRPESISDNNILGLARDRDGNIWIGTEQGVSRCWERGSVRKYNIADFTLSSNGNLFRAILRDSRGDYWLGGGSGLIRVTEGGDVTWFSRENPDSPLESNQIHSIYEDSKGVVWIATDASVARFDGTQFVFCHLTDGGLYRSEWAYDIAEDSQGRLWIATYKGGVFIIDGDTLRAEGGKQPIVSGGIFNSDLLISFYLCPYGDDMWVATSAGFGLTKVDTRTMAMTPTNLYMDAMEFDGTYIWYTAEGEIFRFDPVSGQHVKVDFKAAHGIVNTLIHENGRIWFATSDGVFRVECPTLQVSPVGISSPSFRSSYYDREQGTVLFGGKDCLVTISLDNLERPSRRVLITGVSNSERYLLPGKDYDGEDVIRRSDLHLRRKTGTVYFEISSLTYSASPSAFFYRLTPGGEWTALPVGYNRIPFYCPGGGKFTLDIASADPTLYPDTQVSSYTIRAAYPLLLTPFAKVLYVILAFGLVGAAILIYRRRSENKRREDERRKTLEMATVKMRFFEDLSHEVKAPLMQISAPLDGIIENCTDRKTAQSLSSVRDSAVKLSTLVGKMTDFGQDDNGKKSVLSDSDTKILDSINAIIDQHLDDEDFNVAMLSSLMGMDQKALYRKLMQTAGISPVNYIRKARLRRAAVLLSQGRFTVSEVMYMVGFTNASYFSKCFSEEYGKTPRQFMASGNPLSE